ncbi:MAG: hypothetical protein V3U84_02350 [Thiotrichaceae bacterium]
MQIDSIKTFLIQHGPEVIAALIYLAVNIFNRKTEHWSDSENRIVKTAKFIVELGSVIRSKGHDKKLKLPLTDAGKAL